MKVLKTHSCFGGTIRFWEHDSKSTGTKMKFSTFTPPGKLKGAMVWLSGLTCTDENFMIKAAAQKALAAAGLMVICPDTSPRGLNLPGEHDSYDFGSGAGFYVNATTEAYRENYRMYDYVVNDIHSILQSEFKVEKRIGISGHSMGGHGALVLGLREPSKYKSISAFAPIAHPTQAPWGEKAFTGFLGDSRSEWRAYDAVELLKSGHRSRSTILIDQGSADEFLDFQLMPESLQAVCAKVGQSLELRLQSGYDHSYYFISSFIGDHVEFHAKHL